MNERYLFRGKRLDNGEWVQGFYSLMWGQLHITELIDENTAYPVNLETVGQCTGLCDKNGMLIFEGDVVRVNRKEWVDNGTVGTIEFGMYKHIDASSDYPNGDYGFYIVWTGNSRDLLRKDIIFWLENIEVIGNQWDNPELLEVTDDGGN